MRDKDRFKFGLIVEDADGNVADEVRVYPQYGDDMALRWEKEDDAVYHKSSAEGKMWFVGKECQKLAESPLLSKFTLIVYDRGSEIVRGHFKKTDCKWDMNHEICEVDLELSDAYDGIIGGMDNEYNVVRMGLRKNRLSVKIKPAVEIWINGALDMASVTRNMAMLVPTNGSRISGGKPIVEQFGRVIRTFVGTAIITEGEGAGRYAGDIFFDYGSEITYTLTRDDGLYHITFHGTRTVTDEHVCAWYYARLYKSGQEEYIGYIALDKYDYLTDGGYVVTETSLDELNSVDDLKFSNGSAFKIRIYTVLSRITHMNVREGERFPDDNVRDGEPMRYWTGWQGVVLPSTRIGEEGLYPIQDGGYYLPPDDRDGWVPIYREAWIQGLSMWTRPGLIFSKGDYYFATSSPTVPAIEKYHVYKDVVDFYTLGDVIKGVLARIAEDVVFEPDTAHSQFLFASENPVDGREQGMLYVSQKSNILNIGYDYPAWLAPVTWGKIETLLKNAFNCRWDLYDGTDGKKHLRIEHLSFYMNGGSYDDEQRSVVDLGKYADSINGRKQWFKTDRWEWDTGRMPVRKEYSWMDTQSFQFAPGVIEIPKKYRIMSDERKEDCVVDWFSTDIEFLFIVPEECSSDGFVVAREGVKGYVEEGGAYELQNYSLGFSWLLPRYGYQGMPAEVVEVNGEEMANEYKPRLRTAEVSFAVPAGVEVGAGMLIKTEAGDGEIRSLSLNLTSGTWTAELGYEME